MLALESDAMSHASNSLQLFRGWKAWHIAWGRESRQGNVFMVEDIFAEFARLDGQFGCMLDGVTKSNGEASLAMQDLTSFTSVDQAYAAFALTLCDPTVEADASNKTTVLPNTRYHVATVESRIVLQTAFQRWEARFQDFGWSPYCVQGDPEVLAGLQAWTIVGRLVLGIDTIESQVAWDQYNSCFRRVLDLLGPIIEESGHKHQSCGDMLPAAAIISIANPFSGPITFTAMQCRHRTLRRRALALLSMCPQQNGLWNTKKLIAVATAKMLFEEGAITNTLCLASRALCGCIEDGFICNNHRVSEYHLVDEHTGSGTLILKTVRDVTLQQSGYAITVRW